MMASLKRKIGKLKIEWCVPRPAGVARPTEAGRPVFSCEHIKAKQSKILVKQYFYENPEFSISFAKVNILLSIIRSCQWKRPLCHYDNVLFKTDMDFPGSLNTGARFPCFCLDVSGAAWHRLPSLPARWHDVLNS